MPYTAVRSLVVHPRDRELVIGTFGRSLSIGDVSVIEQLETAMGQPAFLFDVKPAIAHNIRYTWDVVEEINGNMFFRDTIPPTAQPSRIAVRARSGDVSLAVSNAAREGRALTERAGQPWTAPRPVGSRNRCGEGRAAPPGSDRAATERPSRSLSVSGAGV